MSDLYFIEPDAVAPWFPFADSRPIASLPAGAFSIRERWEGTLDTTTTSVFGASHLLRFTEDEFPPVVVPEVVSGPAWVVRSDFAPSGIPLDEPDAAARLVNEGETVGWWVPTGAVYTPGEDPDGEEIEVEGLQLHGAYDLVTALEGFLEEDAAGFTGDGVNEIPDGAIVLGEPENVVLMGCFVEPNVTFDVRNGPVVIDQHTHVRGHTRLVGPLVIGPGCEILGGDISGSAIGMRCKVRGEVSASVFLGYGNKGHDGFVGHSVVGRWVNLGAGTTTSNLKNTYGPIRLDLPDGRRETDRQFLGSLFGDHAKTAIGTMLSTGSLVGVGANVFGDSPPRYVAPFAWGSGEARMKEDGFLKIAERVMPRRNVEFTDAVRDMARDIYEHATR